MMVTKLDLSAQRAKLKLKRKLMHSANNEYTSINLKQMHLNILELADILDDLKSLKLREFENE